AHLGPHGLDGGRVRGLLVALAAPLGGGDGGALGHAHDFEGHRAIDDRLAQAAFSGLELHAIFLFEPCISRGRTKPHRAQKVSMRISCGLPTMNPSSAIRASASRTVASIVEW